MAASHSMTSRRAWLPMFQVPVLGQHLDSWLSEELLEELAAILFVRRAIDFS
jgi:hypothetical protein